MILSKPMTRRMKTTSNRILLAAACATFLLSAGKTARAAQDSAGVLGPAPTPPLGWNSYNCFGAAVLEEEVRANAAFMAQHLKRFGWQYVVIDYCWYYPHPPNSTQENPPQFRLPQDNAPVPWMPMDDHGRLLPDPRKFPSSTNGQGFKPLADYVHSLGLKFGIHIMRGIPRQAVWADTPVLGGGGVRASQIADTNSICTWLNLMYGVDMARAGAQAYYDSLFEQYASWDVDFVKVDDINPSHEVRRYRPLEAEGYRKAMERCGRPMVFSFCSKQEFQNREHLRAHSNMWRVSNDFWDTWAQLEEQFPLCAQWAPYSGPNGWPDADMLNIGSLRLRGPPSCGPPGKSRFTVDEHYTHLTLWSIFRSPLMMGGHLPLADEFTVSLLTNEEVLEVNQRGSHAREVLNADDRVIWLSDAPDAGDKYVALFNTGEAAQTVAVEFARLGLGPRYEVRDLWKRENLGRAEREWQAEVPSHGAKLYRFKALTGN
jgi:hypothetical protein